MDEKKSADSLSQVQDAVDQLAHQFLTCLYYLERRHDLKKLSPNDIVQEQKNDGSQPKLLTSRLLLPSLFTKSY